MHIPLYFYLLAVHLSLPTEDKTPSNSTNSQKLRLLYLHLQIHYTQVVYTYRGVCNFVTGIILRTISRYKFCFLLRLKQHLAFQAKFPSPTTPHRKRPLVGCCIVGDLARIASHNTGAMVSNSHRSSRAWNIILLTIVTTTITITTIIKKKNQHTPVKSQSLAMKLRIYLHSISETNLYR